MSDAPPRVTIVITTHNRCLDVIRAIESCLAQTMACEILVYDDASPDQTAETLRTRFRSIRVVRTETRCGLIALRNRGFREGLGDIIVSMDDDAYFTDPATITQVVDLFDQYPLAAALALPFIEPHSARQTMSPVPRATRMRNFMGCSHAIRRHLALAMDGYPELLIHQGEERDLCIRLLDRGYEILCADTPPIVHLYSAQRDHSRVNYYGFRNTILFCWMRLPFPECLLQAVISTLKLLTYQFSWNRLGIRLQALAAGWFGLLIHQKWRCPVSRRTYRLFQHLPGHGPGFIPSFPAPSPPGPAGPLTKHTEVECSPASNGIQR